MCTRPRTRIPGLVLAVVVLLAATACGGSDNPSDAAPTSPSETQSSPTDTETSLSPQEKDEQQAVQAVKDYQKVVEDLGSHPNKTLSKMAKVARDQAIAQQQRNLTMQRSRGQRTVGRSEVTNSRVEYQGNNVFKVRYCLDVSDLGLVNQAGESVVPDGRPDTRLKTVEVTEDDNGFYVTQTDGSREWKTC